MAGVYTVRPGAGKAIDINQFPPEAWSRVLGTDGDDDQLQELFKLVPWLNRGVVLLSNALSAMPFVILNKRGDEIDGSEDYQNATGLWAHPKKDLWRMEAALTLFGRSYHLIERRSVGRRAMGMRYLVPTTVRALIDPAQGLTGFERKVSGRDPERFEVEDILHIFAADPYGEIGAPDWSRAMAAMAAAQVLKNVDAFAAEFFEKGMIKTTLLSISGGVPPQEIERISSLWGRIMRGMRTAFSKMVVNADAVTPIQIGEGIGELGNTELTREKREDIATALGVPHSLLFSNATNFATAEQDKRNLYEETVIPDADLIAEAINEQYLGPAGYQLKFQHHTMDIFQEDEEDRSGAALNLINAAVVAPPSVVRLMFEIMGVELPGDMEWEEFERILAEAKEAGREQAAEIASGQAQDGPKPTLRPAAGTMPQADDDIKALADDLERWKRKAINRLKSGGSAGCSFDSDAIPADVALMIEEALDEADTPAKVGRLFAELVQG